MDKNVLIRLESTMRSIKTQLLLNENIRKLLFYTEIEDLEEVETPSINAVKSNIFLQPIIDVDVEPPFNKKNYITITVPDSRKRPNDIDYVFRVIVQCDKTCWTYGEGFIRPLRICQEILNTIEGQRFSCAGQLKFDSLVETVTNKTVSGYSILFSLLDGIGDPDDYK